MSHGVLSGRELSHLDGTRVLINGQNVVLFGINLIVKLKTSRLGA